jgi:sensor c-di-GMP phosphodiesterase-like protein
VVIIQRDHLGMRRSGLSKLMVAGGVLAMALPLLAALYIAHHQTLAQETDLAQAMAAEVLRRTNAAGDQAALAHRRLQEGGASEPCAEERIALMRSIDMASPYLQLVGHVEDGRLRCSSMGDHRLGDRGDGVSLGPAAYVSTTGAAMRTLVDLGLAEGVRFLLVEKDGVAAALHAESLVDTFLDRPDVSLGVYGHSGEQLLSGRGVFEPRWMKRLGKDARVRFFDGRHLVVLQRSAPYDLVAYVAVPEPYLRARLYAFAMVLLPIGLLVGALLLFAMLRVARQRTSLPAALRSGLRRREFVLHYQPIVDLATRRTVGMEALLRWPVGGGAGMRADVFIPAAEDCGLIGQFTAYVVDQVAQDLPRLLAADPRCYVSINLSAADLKSTSTVERLRVLVSTGLVRPQNLIVEATEHSFLDPEAARSVVAGIRALGVRVAIDDFGTGYSNLAQITQLQTDYLKIDKSFVEAVGTDAVTNEVALHVIQIARSLRLSVIGEGVETEQQAAFLQDNGVQWAQGWLFSKALTMDGALELLKAQTGPSPLDAA